MKTIEASDITAAVRKAFLTACIAPGGDVDCALEKAHKS